jgi:hypothetical protein
MNLVQLIREGQRRVGIVDGDRLRLIERFNTVYAMAQEALVKNESLVAIASGSTGTESFEYAPIHEGRSEWRILPSFDHPYDPAHCLVSGTGLTHKASAENRAAMHKSAAAQLTDSARMYQMGLEGGNPRDGDIGVQPEWFYKGDGSILRGHGETLEIPPYGGDGGEEPEIAGAYLISAEGKPYRVGLTVANEFSDHQMEKINYLYLAPSKLRSCSIGPELAIGDLEFEHVPGSVSVLRNDATIWRKDIWTGQKNMSHSVANLEHHHFKYAAHRRSGDVHIHFFGADAFSFGEGLALEAGDLMEVWFPQFGRPLRNKLGRSTEPDRLTRIEVL